MLTAEQLDDRRTGLGGSDIGAILGLNPWKTPLDVWHAKQGVSEDAGDSEAAYWGTALEDLVARRYADLTGYRVQRVNALLHKPGTCAIANIDRAIINPHISGTVRVRGDGTLTTDRILECKTAHALSQGRADWGEAGTDNVPPSYWAQTQWYLGITGASVCDLAVLFGGQRHMIYTIPADASLFADLLTEAERWWMKHIVLNTPPDPRSADEARRLWPRHIAGKQQEVDVAVADDVARLAELRGQISAIEKQEEALKTHILTAFGDAEEIVCEGRSLATWKANKDGVKTDWKALAASCNPPQTLIDTYTTTTPGARVLRLAKEAA